LDKTNIRVRDEGRRHLVDLRIDGGRLFFELTFPTALNPLSAKTLLQGMTCPPVL
jgi:type VI protein secretion system component VasK